MNALIKKNSLISLRSLNQIIETASSSKTYVITARTSFSVKSVFSSKFIIVSAPVSIENSASSPETSAESMSEAEFMSDVKLMPELSNMQLFAIKCAFLFEAIMIYKISVFKF